VKNGVKMASRVSVSMPDPVSVTVIWTESGPGAAATVSVPPPGIAS